MAHRGVTVTFNLVVANKTLDAAKTPYLPFVVVDMLNADERF